jgi:guanine nucleotide-binding protein G(I)/G(S)/G(T) subunit beta-1
LKEQVDKLLAVKKDQTIGNAVRAKGMNPSLIRGPQGTKLRRTLKGHFGKITAMHWGGDSQALISASQDGKLLLWNAVTTNKLYAISLKSNYVMAVAMEQMKGKLVACGGLDNLCTVYRLHDPEKAIEMASHDGFVSSCRFLDESKILSASGDSTVILWDISQGQPLAHFTEHTQDVMALAISPTSNQNTFVSTSVDRTAKLWDIRVPDRAAVQTFSGHEGDINAVDFMQNGMVFGTGSEDGTARIFDLRAHNEVSRFGKVADGSEGLTSVSFSRSGRVFFGGHADSNVLAWDVLSDKAAPTFTLQAAHEQHVSCIGVNPKGDALCTGSWDATLKIWA